MWAEENTRESIYAALRRKETFCHIGPPHAGKVLRWLRLSRRFAEAAARGRTSASAECQWVANSQRSPCAALFVQAARDPREIEASLQRAQVVKSWIDESGATHERVFDVACSDGLTPDPKTHRCPDNGASVDLDDCSISLAKGDAQLVTLWNDPTFDPAESSLLRPGAAEPDVSLVNMGSDSARPPSRLRWCPQRFRSDLGARRSPVYPQRSSAINAAAVKRRF